MATRTTTELRSLWGPPCKVSLAKVTLHGGAVISVRAAILDAVKALDDVFTEWDYRCTPPDCGAYVCRQITGGTGYSLHAYGIAIDVNWQTNPYGPTLITDMDPGMIADIEAIRSNSGAVVWRWGGRYGGNKDAMHFEVVASPAEIASGIAPRTAPVPTPQAPPTITGDPMSYRMRQHHTGDVWLYEQDGASLERVLVSATSDPRPAHVKALQDMGVPLEGMPNAIQSQVLLDVTRAI